jgi:hypothetical protein
VYAGNVELSGRLQFVTAAVRSRDGASLIGPLLSRLSELVDDIVVAIDSRGIDGTEKIGDDTVPCENTNPTRHRRTRDRAAGRGLSLDCETSYRETAPLGKT